MPKPTCFNYADYEALVKSQPSEDAKAEFVCYLIDAIDELWEGQNAITPTSRLPYHFLKLEAVRRFRELWE